MVAWAIEVYGQNVETWGSCTLWHVEFLGAKSSMATIKDQFMDSSLWNYWWIIGMFGSLMWGLNYMHFFISRMVNTFNSMHFQTIICLPPILHL
jgi:hypothetical protein